MELCHFKAQLHKKSTNSGLFFNYNKNRLFFLNSLTTFSINSFAASIKSVSDFADIKKNDNYQEYASYTSAALLKYILENELSF